MVLCVSKAVKVLEQYTVLVQKGGNPVAFR
jgi:hypothetical protein